MANSTVVDDAREPLRLPAFEKAVMFAVTQALEKWRDEAMEGATPGYLSPNEFLRHAVNQEG